MTKRIEKPEKDSKAYLEAKVKTGRGGLLMVLIFTVVNVAFLLLDMNTYFLFSAAVPYYLTVLGLIFDSSLFGEWGSIDVFTLTALGISLVILGAFFLCWLLSKKRLGWLIAALVLFVVDTICLAGFTWLLMENPLENLVDFLFHFWVIWELIQAVRAWKKGNALTPEPVRGPEEPWNADPEF